MKVSFSRKSAEWGFSAVELLVVIAVIAIGFWLVAPYFSSVTKMADGGQSHVETADTVKDQSNAKSIVAMWSSVAALGGNLPDTKDGCINALLAGTNVAFAGTSTHYQISGMNAGDIALARKHISFESAGSRLVFHPEGGQ